jgi:hypothetical protein
MRVKSYAAAITLLLGYAPAATADWTGSLIVKVYSDDTCTTEIEELEATEVRNLSEEGCICQTHKLVQSGTILYGKQCNTYDGCDKIGSSVIYQNGGDSDCSSITSGTTADFSQQYEPSYPVRGSSTCTKVTQNQNGARTVIYIKDGALTTTTGDIANGCEDPCFPSSSMITKADGTPSRIDALKEGDEIVAATAGGTLTTDTVSLLSIAKPEAHAKSLLALTTAANTTLILTPEHHVPIGEKCCSTLKKAKDVAVGDTAWAVKDGAAATATTITAITKANGQGLHSPVLTHGGFPVVDGLVTSFDSIEKVELAKFGLAPLLAACKATGTCAKFRELFLAGDREYVEALRRRRL